MAYLYAGLGIALIIPLMAMVQTLVGLTSLEAKYSGASSRQLALISASLNSFGIGLTNAMNVTGQIVDKAPNLNKKSCDLLPMNKLKPPAGSTSVNWFGTYPDCVAVFADEADDLGFIPRLRVEMSVKTNINDFPASLTKNSKGLYPMPSDSLRVTGSCWTSLGMQQKECS